MRNIFVFIILSFSLLFCSNQAFSQDPQQDLDRLKKTYTTFDQKVDDIYKNFDRKSQGKYRAFEKWLDNEQDWINITLKDTKKKKDYPSITNNPQKEKEWEEKKQKEIKKITPNKPKKELPNKKVIKKEKLKKELPNKEVVKKEKPREEKKEITEANKFIRPVPTGYHISSRFGYRIHPIGHVRKFHYGIDLGCAKGTPIYAAFDGKVLHSVYSKSYGNFIILSHPGNRKTVYAHMSKRLVKKGENVKKGQIIGKVGSTGYSTGPHLHFEIIVNGKKVNPESIIKF